MKCWVNLRLEQELQEDAPCWYVGLWLRRYFRLRVYDMKEKFGTWRVYVAFGFFSMEDILYPGYRYTKFPPWLRDIDWGIGVWVCKWLLNPWVVPLQRRAYGFRYRQAIRKWPKEERALREGADYPELIDK